MKSKVWMMRRSILLGLIALLLILTPTVVRAIAPGANLFAQIPALSKPASDQTPAQDWLLRFSQMPGGQVALSNSPAPATSTSPAPSARFTPRQERVTVNPTNYDRRMPVDIYGNPSLNAPIIVIHETVGSAASAINTFRNNHPNDNDQVSYHSLIKRDGTIVYLVPPEMRAYGAGNSIFNGPDGVETVRLDPVLPASVNNFAYHTSLESPSDGRGNSRNHSGYTEAQYRSLGWLVAQTQVPQARITTHRAVDRSGTRRDPRSFDSNRFLAQLRMYGAIDQTSSSTSN